MNKKLFAFDMDGTLLDSNGQVINETIDALKQAKEKGHILVIATGRPFHFIDTVVGELNLFDYYICTNGSMIYDVKSKEVISSSSIPYEVLENMLVLAKEQQTIFLAHTPFKIHAIDFNSDKDIVQTGWGGINKSSEEKILEETKNSQLTQITIQSDKEKSLLLRDYLVKFSDKAEVCISADIFLDANPKDITKMSGLVELLENLEGIQTKDIVAFGDSGNDLQMLLGVGLGISMGNGSSAAKEAADKIIEDHNTNAIAKEIIANL